MYLTFLFFFLQSNKRYFADWRHGGVTTSDRRHRFDVSSKRCNDQRQEINHRISPSTSHCLPLYCIILMNDTCAESWSAPIKVFIYMYPHLGRFTWTTNRKPLYFFAHKLKSRINTFLWNVVMKTTFPSCFLDISDRFWSDFIRYQILKRPYIFIVNILVHLNFTYLCISPYPHPHPT